MCVQKADELSWNWRIVKPFSKSTHLAQNPSICGMFKFGTSLTARLLFSLGRFSIDWFLNPGTVLSQLVVGWLVCGKRKHTSDWLRDTRKQVTHWLLPWRHWSRAWILTVEPEKDAHSTQSGVSIRKELNKLSSHFKLRTQSHCTTANERLTDSTPCHHVRGEVGVAVTSPSKTSCKKVNATQFHDTPHRKSAKKPRTVKTNTQTRQTDKSET